MQGQGGRKPGSTDRLNMHLLLTVPPAVRIQNCSDHVTKWHASCVCFVVLWQWSIFSTTGEEGRRDHNRYNDHLILRVSSSAAKHKIKHIPAAEAITVDQKRCPSCENEIHRFDSIISIPLAPPPSPALPSALATNQISSQVRLCQSGHEVPGGSSSSRLLGGERTRPCLRYEVRHVWCQRVTRGRGGDCVGTGGSDASVGVGGCMQEESKERQREGGRSGRGRSGG